MELVRVGTDGTKGIRIGPTQHFPFTMVGHIPTPWSALREPVSEIQGRYYATFVEEVLHRKGSQIPVQFCRRASLGKLVKLNKLGSPPVTGTKTR